MTTLGLTMRRLTILSLLCLVPLAAVASDHADPIVLRSLDAGITGLFAFQDGDDLAIILTVRRATSTQPPFDLDGFEYTVHIDTHSRAQWSNAENNARYGGTVANPEGISADAVIRFRLDNNGGFARGYPALYGFKTENTRPTNEFAGLRDDPFIFPRFAATNVIAMAVTIPFSALNGDPSTFLLWGTTTTEGFFGGTKQIDHVGRSARTQAGRFDFLNTLPPDQHVQAIQSQLNGWQASLSEALAHGAMHVPGLGAPGDLFKYVLGLRARYDVFPDVMIFSTQRPAGYPNGRRPSDDVVGLTCAVGDCVLQEVASFEAPEGEFPRVIVHSPPASAAFPYLTDPLPEGEHEPHPDHCLRNFLLILLALFALLTLWRRWKQHRAETPWVRPLA